LKVWSDFITDREKLKTSPIANRKWAIGNDRSHDLRSEFLTNGDLIAALERVAEQLTAGTGIRSEVSVTGAPRVVPEVVTRNLLRVGQEALTNAVRHAEAGRVQVRLRSSAASSASITGSLLV
jgi:signal transduction histidine kinase